MLHGMHAYTSYFELMDLNTFDVVQCILVIFTDS